MNRGSSLMQPNNKSGAHINYQSCINYGIAQCTEYDTSCDKIKKNISILNNQYTVRKVHTVLAAHNISADVLWVSLI